MSLIRKIAISAVTAATLFTAASTIANSFIYERLYYATSAQTNIVGESIILCDGREAFWGVRTPHSRLVSKEPCGWGW